MDEKDDTTSVADFENTSLNAILQITMDEKDDTISVADIEDSGSEYLSSPAPSSCNDDSAELQQSKSSSATTLQQPLPSMSNSMTAEPQICKSTAETTDETPIVKSRKRLKKTQTWQRNVIRLKRAKGEQYENHKKNIVPAKTPKTGKCLCSKKCHLKLNEERQLEIFKSFYALANFDTQNALLFSLVRVTNKCRSYTGNKESRRQNTYIYYLLGDDGVELQVCKKFFLRTFQVSDGRVTRVLKHKIMQYAPPIDQRGRQSSVNKTPDNKIAEVKEFIGRFPVYESTRQKSENRRFLSPDLSLGQMYALYKDNTDEPVSYFIFNKIFNDCFNLRIHKDPKK